MRAYLQHGTAGDYDFFAWNDANQVWNGSAYVTPVDGDVASYRIASTPVGSTGWRTGATPAGCAWYELRFRAGTMAASLVQYTSADESPALLTAIAAIPTSGAGPYVHTVTVTLGGDPVSGARVTLTGNYLAITNGSGVASFAVNTTGSYAVAVHKDGLANAAAVATVSASGQNTAVAMSALSLSLPADPDLSTGYCVTYDGHGAAMADVTLTFSMLDPYPGDDDAGDATAWTLRNFTAVSDNDGLLQTTFKRGGSYRGKRGKGEWVSFTVPDAGSFELPKVLSEAGS